MNLQGITETNGACLDDFAKRFHRPRIGSLNQYYWLQNFHPNDATLPPFARGELNRELQWARKRKSSHAKVHDCIPTAFLCDAEYGPAREGMMVRDGESAYEVALNGMERKFLDGYRRKAKRRHVPNANLQNNPEKMSLCKLVDRTNATLPTVVKSMHLTWTDQSLPHGVFCSRWMASTEALTSQGYRLHPAVRRPYRQSSFDIALAGRKGYCLREAAGNAMHLSCVGLLWVHVGLNTRFTPPSSSPRCHALDRLCIVDSFGTTHTSTTSTLSALKQSLLCGSF